MGVKSYNDDSEIKKYREFWRKKGYELVNITTLCEIKLGHSGSGTGFNEPDDTIHHIQIHYRDENICAIFPHIKGLRYRKNEGESFVVDENKHLLYVDDEGDFIVFMKCKNEDDLKPNNKRKK